MRAAVAVLSPEPVKLVPGRFLVGDVDAPLNVHERAVVPAAFDCVAELERPPMRVVLVVEIDLKARGLPFDASLGVLELRRGDFVLAVR
jgi:hypothetical protein